jgi:acyl dehydratase
MRTFTSADELVAAAGQDLGTSGWHTVTQNQINAFADATGDHQWIHIDAERAATGPFGVTIAHGYLTLSLIPILVHEVYEVRGARMTVNYGVNRVRFPAPLPSGSDVRAQVSIDTVTVDGDRTQVVAQVTIAARDAEKPCCVAETVTRFYF